MSIYSAFFDSVKQKEDVLKSNDHIGLIKDFRAKLKMDYLIYGSVVFTDAQIFDGAVFHAMLNEDDHYWNDFVNFIEASPCGSIVIKHGGDSLSKRIDRCLGNEDFELSSLAIYDEYTISNVNDSRIEAVDAGKVTDASDNQFYYNISQIKNTLMSDKIKRNRVFSSWDAPENKRSMLGLFQGNSPYYKSFKNKLNSFELQLKPYKEYQVLTPIIETIENQFNPEVVDLIPRRSDWKSDIDNLIKGSDNDDFIELANKLLLFLSDCYITLCAHQHKCQFASLESPFSLGDDSKLSKIKGWFEDKNMLEKTIKNHNTQGIYLSNGLLNSLRDESYDDFLKNIRSDKIQKHRDEWLASFYGKNEPFNAKLLNNLIGEVYTLYYESSKAKEYKNIGQDMIWATIPFLLELADVAIRKGISTASELAQKPEILLAAFAVALGSVTIIKLLKPLIGGLIGNAMILAGTKLTEKTALNLMNLQKVTQFDNMICRP